MSKKGIAAIIIVLIIVGALAIGGGVYYYSVNSEKRESGLSGPEAQEKEKKAEVDPEVNQQTELSDIKLKEPDNADEPTDKEEIEQKTRTQAEKCYAEIVNQSYSRPGMPNPAPEFCQCMGGEPVTKKADGKEKTYCKTDSGSYEQWEYFDKMNPYDNSITPCPLGYDKWVEFCEKNRSSVYCKRYNP